MVSVLLIEDKEAYSGPIREYLAAADEFELIQVKALEGEDRFRSEKAVDVVIMDLFEPETARARLQHYLDYWTHLPMIALIAPGDEVTGMLAVKAGAQDFLTHGDFDPERLVNAIRYAIQRFNAHSRLWEGSRAPTRKGEEPQAPQPLAGGSGAFKMDIVSNAMNWSDAVFHIFGFPSDTLKPMLSDYLHATYPEDRERVNGFFEQVIKSGKPAVIEHRIQLNGHSLKYLQLRAGIEFDASANKILLAGEVEDITREKLNRPVVQEPDPAVASDKVSRFAQLSYNIRTPLSSIVNLLYLLEKSNFSTQQRELIEGLKTSVDDLSVVLNNLLNYSLFISEDLRLQEEVFDLEALINNVARSGTFKAEQAGLQFEYEQEGELPERVRGDESKLQQVLLNLLELAIIHTVGDRSVRLLVARPSPAQLKVEVTYTGKPIQVASPDGEENGNLMKMIFTDEAEEKSTTPHLNTFIATRLSKLLGGALEVARPSERDCCLRFTWGIDAEMPSEALAPTAAPVRPITILLVEDHFLNQIATKKVLTSWSDRVEVITADNGEEALDLFRQAAVDLILMDLKIPKVSGIEAARIIRRESDVPIIALTASSSKQEEERCFIVGMNAYIHKPIKPEELYTKISKLIY